MKVNLRLVAFFITGLMLPLNVLAMNQTSNHHYFNHSAAITRIFPLFTLACFEKSHALMPKIARSSPPKKVFEWAPITIHQKTKTPRQRYQRKVIKPLPPPINIETVEEKYNLTRTFFKTSFESYLSSKTPKLEAEKIFALEKRLFSSMRKLEKNRKNSLAKDAALIIAEALTFSSFTPKIDAIILDDVEIFLASKRYNRASEQNKTLLIHIFIMENILSKVTDFENNLENLALNRRSFLNLKFKKYFSSKAGNRTKIAKNSIWENLGSSLENLDENPSAERITWIIAEAIAPIVWNHRSKTRIFTEDVQPFLLSNSYTYASDDEKFWLTQIFICETISQKLDQKLAEQTILNTHIVQEKTRARDLFRDQIKKNIVEDNFEPIITERRKRCKTLKKVKAQANLQLFVEYDGEAKAEESTPKAWSERFELLDLEPEEEMNSFENLSIASFKQNYDQQWFIDGESEFELIIDKEETCTSETSDGDGYKSDSEDKSFFMVTKDSRNRKGR